MLPPQEVSIYLNNALKATPKLAELERDEPLPDACGAMPASVNGRFVELDAEGAEAIRSAWKRVMILNPTQVLYTFTFDAATGGFTATIR
jgi:hypothetical protein